MKIDLAYGRGAISVDYEPARFSVLAPPPAAPSLTDSEIGSRFDVPIASPPIEELVQPGQSVLIVVPDATRQAAAGQIVNLLVRRLIANGTEAFDIRIIFATGIHRRVTAAEREAIVTPFIAQRIKCLDHDPRDLARLVRLGETAGGVPVELNRAVVDHDVTIIVGGIGFHYFAGFTGGRKLICPGLASSRTVSATHKLAFDCDTRSRRVGVGTGLMKGNAVHEAFVEAAALAPPTFCISSIVNDQGELVDMFCGDWIASHEAACDVYAANYALAIGGRRPVVIASCSGRPYDLNMIQAHKTLEAASHACTKGGTIVLIAECPDGTGRADLLEWFDAPNSAVLAERLCSRYQVNGQTAWNLMRIAERCDICVVTSMDEAAISKMKLRSITHAELDRLIMESGAGYIVPHGSRTMITLET